MKYIPIGVDIAKHLIFMNGDHPITPCVSIVVAYIFKENDCA